MFYEAGNSRRSDIRIYELLVRPLCGIGEDSFRDYRHYSPEKLDGYDLPEELKSLLLLHVTVRKVLPGSQIGRYLKRLAVIPATAVESEQRKSGMLTAGKLLKYLQVPHNEVFMASRREVLGLLTVSGTSETGNFQRGVAG